MTAQIIDGKLLAAKIKKQVQADVALLQKRGTPPGLAVVLVGANPASEIYVAGKLKACLEAGIRSFDHRLPASVSESELLQRIDTLNNNPEVHGILVQLPLPAQIDSHKILARVNPRKDVDGFHPVNMGRLATGLSGPTPCTPGGVMKMLESIHFDPAGKHAVVLGRSNIVGKPMALLLLQANATVTICHSHTKNISAIVAEADLVVAAIGKPEFVQGAWLKKNCVVIDVGMNRLKNGKLVGDVDFATASKVASFISPVPGGVGPMTIAMLLRNTKELYDTANSAL